MMSFNSPSFENENDHPEMEHGETRVAEDLNALLHQYPFSPGVSLDAEVQDAKIFLEETADNVWKCCMEPIFTARPPYTMIEGVIDMMHWSVHDINGCLVAEGIVGDEQTFTFFIEERGYPFILSFSFSDDKFAL